MLDVSHAVSLQGAWCLGSGSLGRLTRTAQLMHFFLPLYARIHTLPPFSPQRGIPALVTLKNPWYGTHIRAVLKASQGLLGNVFPRAPTGTTRTSFRPSRGKTAKLWKCAVALPVSSPALLSMSPGPASSEPTLSGTADHHGTARSGHPQPVATSCILGLGPGVLVFAHLPAVVL